MVLGVYKLNIIIVLNRMGLNVDAKLSQMLVFRKRKVYIGQQNAAENGRKLEKLLQHFEKIQ